MQRLRAVRFDGLWWRRFAYLGSAYGPEWWKRYSPTWIAAILFACVGSNRRGVVTNMRRVLGRQGRWHDLWNGFLVFKSFAHCLNETLEFSSPRRQPIDIDHPAHARIAEALARGRGAVFVTCHFGNWDIAAKSLSTYGVPVNVVMARETNETTAEYVRKAREDGGLRILLSDGSVFRTFSMLQALRRREIVALQLDRPHGGPGTRPVQFFGAPAPFQVGPLRLARSAQVPIFAAFVLRDGPRRYRVVVGEERLIPRNATTEEVDRVLAGIVREFEDLVRAHPDQWFQFAPFWPADVPEQATVPEASTPEEPSRPTRPARTA